MAAVVERAVGAQDVRVEDVVVEDLERGALLRGEGGEILAAGGGHAEQGGEESRGGLCVEGRVGWRTESLFEGGELRLLLIL